MGNISPMYMIGARIKVRETVSAALVDGNAGFGAVVRLCGPRGAGPVLGAVDLARSDFTNPISAHSQRKGENSSDCSKV